MKILKTKVGIIGAGGYAGGELIRLLVNHPWVEITFAQSKSCAGRKLSEVHTDLLGETELVFAFTFNEVVDILFLCGAHGDAEKFMQTTQIDPQTKIIDLSQDFRLSTNNTIKERTFVYGLPELNRDQISQSQNVSNPGCFATAIQLALLPLAKAKGIKSDVHINATTGSSGAGQGLSATSHFSWRQNNLSTYKEFDHQHLNEISETIQKLQLKNISKFHFVPQRGSFTRGIFSSLYTECDLSELDLTNLYMEFYKNHPFVFITQNEIDLKQVTNTNKCFLQIKKKNNIVFIISVIDNLLKGASGQAVQNMNLMMGWEETTGLKLKANAY